MTDNLLQRDIIIATLRNQLEPLPYVNAMWEGGSAAFDRLDAWSDIDLHLDVADDAVEATFEQMEAALLSLSPISDTMRIPEPTWHGHSQCFYTLEKAGEFLKIDCAVMRHSGGDKFIQPELHGTALVYFDKLGVVDPEPFDWEAHNQKLAMRLQEIGDRFGRMQIYVRKEILRQDALNALQFYRGITLNPLVELLRIKYDPARYNWSVRYLSHYLPADEADKLTELSYIANLDELAAKRESAEKWVTALLSELTASFTN